MQVKNLRRISIIFCFLLAILLVGCGYGYSGEYADLYTVAINSVLWNLGHSYGADFARNSDIEIIEQDEFGRTLFSYHEKYYSGGDFAFSALIISQYSADGLVYYYEDCNYIIKKQEPYASNLQGFEIEQVEQLKVINDWGKPIDAEKCISKTIIRNKQKISDVESAVIDKVITENDLSLDRYNAFAHYLTDDKNGNYIVYGVIKIHQGEEFWEDLYFVAFVSADNEKIEVLVPSDLYNYTSEFVNFKKENGWVSK